jgi:hypothetical protein
VAVGHHNGHGAVFADAGAGGAGRGQVVALQTRTAACPVSPRVTLPPLPSRTPGAKLK